jgi:uncharacterized protein YegP (UPF0339 family)
MTRPDRFAGWTPAKGGNGGTGAHAYAIEVDRNGLYRWNLFAPTGQIIASSAVGFVSEPNAERAVRAEARQREIEVVPRLGRAA